METSRQWKQCLKQCISIYSRSRIYQIIGYIKELKNNLQEPMEKYRADAHTYRTHSWTASFDIWHFAPHWIAKMCSSLQMLITFQPCSNVSWYSLHIKVSKTHVIALLWHVAPHLRVHRPVCCTIQVATSSNIFHMAESKMRWAQSKCNSGNGLHRRPRLASTRFTHSDGCRTTARKLQKHSLRELRLQDVIICCASLEGLPI